MDTSTSLATSVSAIVLPNQVITYRHKHGVDLIAATGSNVLALAKKMFGSSARLQAINERITEIHAMPEEDKPAIRGHLWLWRALQEVMTNDQSDKKSLHRLFYGNVPKSEDGQCKSVEVKPEWREELLSWLAIREYDDRAPKKLVESLSSSRDIGEEELFLTKEIFKALDFLAPSRSSVGMVEFFSADALDTVSEYRVLAADKWKTEALSDPRRSMNVLGRYLSFLNDLNGSGFDLSDISQDVEDFNFCVY